MGANSVQVGADSDQLCTELDPFRPNLGPCGEAFPQPRTVAAMTTDSDEAAGVVRIAAKRLATAYPFHAHLLSLASVEEANHVTTMAVTVRQARVVLLYSPAFVLAHQFDEIVAVLHHEVLHVVFGHLFQGADRYPNRMALTIAQEVTVNEWVPERLPVDGVMLKDYPELPPGEDTDTRYQRLAARTSEQQEVVLIDDHGVWEEVASAGQVAEAAVMSTVRRAADMLTPEERDRITSEMQAVIDEACRGKAAGRSIERLGDAEATVDWRNVLRRFVGRGAVRQPSYLRPPRRFPHLAGIVPGNVRRMDKPRVMAVIDTSASMTPELLSQIGAELARIRTTHAVVIVECDTEIQRIYPMVDKLLEVHGRGDTDLRPPFASDVLLKVRPDVVVYFTDGYGPAPERPPKVPVLWCLTPSAMVPAPWGRTVWIK